MSTNKSLLRGVFLEAEPEQEFKSTQFIEGRSREKGNRGRKVELSMDVVPAGNESQPDPTGVVGDSLQHRVGLKSDPGADLLYPCIS